MSERTLTRTSVLAVTAIFAICLPHWPLSEGLARAQTPALGSAGPAISLHAWDILGTAVSRVPSHLSFSAGTWLALRGPSATLRGFEGEGEVDLARHRLTAHVVAALPLMERVSIAVDVPMLLDSDGDDPREIAPSWSQAAGAGLGDLRISAKVVFVRPRTHGFGVGMTQDLTFPTATGDQALVEASVTWRTRLVLDFARTGYGVSLNVGYLVRQAAEELEPAVGDELQLAVAVQFPLLGDTLELLASNQTRTLVDHPFSGDRATENTTRAGLRLRPFSNLVITAAGGMGFGSLLGSAPWEAALQIAWEPRPGRTGGSP